MLRLLALFLMFLGVAHAGEPIPLRKTVPAAGSLDCTTDPCGYALPAAVRFRRVDGKPYSQGFDAAGEPVGWVVLSTDVVDIKAYSGKPLATLVGLDADGVITGARVIFHSEPILLVGIPESKLHDFVDFYAGVPAITHVTVGKSASDGVAVDSVSGATVTVLAQNQTILSASRNLGVDVGVIERHEVNKGHFVTDRAPLTWAQMTSSGALQSLVIAPSDMGAEGTGPFLSLWFGLADAPHIGIPLIGEREYQHQMGKLEPGEHLFVAFNSGSYSFKGSGFVRGGIFDRFRLEQGLAVQTFRDLDYKNIGPPKVADAPPLREGGLFVSRDSNIDPGAPYNLVFLASQYDTSGGAFNRDFRSFEVEHRLPSSVYVVEGQNAEVAIVLAAWSSRPWRPILLVGWLALITGLFVGRKWLTRDVDRLKKIHVGVMLGSFIILGLVLRAQPSITQLLTILGGIAGEWRWSLFLSDPLLFLSWIFIAGLLFIWGRGVFCGWACPYGSASEVLFKLARKVGIPEFEVPDAIHHKAKYVRYLVLGGLVAAYLYDAQLGEQLAEVEPFKSSFFVYPWTRHPALFGWWIFLVLWSVFTWRPFCQYLCPLGAAIAVPSFVRSSGPLRRDFCTKCKICTRTCEPRAIDANGVINGADCLNCMECEANYYDDQTCPPLVKLRRDFERAEQTSMPAGPSK